MLGILSFLAFLCGLAFLASLVWLVVRVIKKKSWKPFAAAAVISVVCVLALSVPISQLYVPKEPEADPIAPSTSPAVETTANVEKPVENVEKPTAFEVVSAVPAQTAPPETTSPPETTTVSVSVSSVQTTTEPEPEVPAEPDLTPVSDLRFNGEPISDVAVRDLSGTSGVLDLYVEFSEDTSEINITVQVPSDLDQDGVKSTGERVVRYLASLACYSDSGYSMPDNVSLGGLYDHYSLLIYLDDGSGSVSAYGAKVPSSPVITWRVSA